MLVVGLNLICAVANGWALWYYELWVHAGMLVVNLAAAILLLLLRQERLAYLRQLVGQIRAR